MDGQIITEEDELSQAFSYVSSNSRRELILKAKTGQIIWDFLKENGWTDTAIAGVLGNFQQESGLTADMHQKGGGTGYGLGPVSYTHLYIVLQSSNDVFSMSILFFYKNSSFSNKTQHI